MATPERIAWMAAVFDEVWPREGTSDVALEIYLAVLPDVPDNVLVPAVEKLVSEATFRPRPAEVRQTALDLMLPRVPTAYEAWAEVKARLRPGHLRDEWSSPLVGKALEGIGGLDAFRMSDRADESYWMNAFFKAYDTLARRQREEVRMLPQVREAVRAKLEEGRRLLQGGQAWPAGEEVG